MGNIAADAYLVEHPDHHLAFKLGLVGLGENGSKGADLQTGSIASGLRLEEARLSFYEDMTALFQAMEESVKAGTGGAYGVSSAGLSLPEQDPMHVSWERLLTCAEEAASRAGRER